MSWTPNYSISYPRMKKRINRWSLIRLVCHEWSLWYSVEAIRYFTGRLDRLVANGRILEGMTNLTELVIYNLPSSHDEESEALKSLAARIPSSVRRLNTCSAKLLISLPRSTSSSLQTISLSCGIAEPRMLETLRNLFRKFGGRIRHLDASRVPTTPDSQTNIWEEVLCDSSLEELSLHGGYTWDLNFKIPATLKQLNVAIGCPCIDWKALLPACETLEAINAPNATLTIDSNMSAFPSLKEILVGELNDPLFGQHLVDRESLLMISWPNLEKIQLKYLPQAQIRQGLRKLQNLRSIIILGKDNEEDYFDLSNLPPQLEEFKYRSNHVSEVRGQPLEEMKHLRKLNFEVCDLNLTKGVFNFTPALEELHLSTNQESDCKGIEWEELAPLRHSLVRLIVDICDNDTDILHQFSRLKHLTLTGWQEEPLILGRLPQSLEELVIQGDFTEGHQIEPLPNLKEIELWDLSENSANLVSSILLNAPNLRKIKLRDLEYLQAILKGIKGLKFEKLTQLITMVESKTIPKSIFQMLQISPNIVRLEMSRDYSKNSIAGFPAKLLSFLKSNPTAGLRLETVKVNHGLHLRDLNEASKAALEELQNIGVRFEMAGTL